MTGQHTILVVEDSPTLAATYQAQLEPMGQKIVVASDGKSAYEALRAQPIACVLLDLKLPDMDGLAILEDLRSWRAPPAVVVITANASLTTAVQAVRLGAFDYLVKPFAAARLTTTVQNALKSAELQLEVQTLRRTVERPEFANFVGRSMPMQAVYRTIEAAASSSAAVFITGESGTGKELAAEALHRLGSRSSRRFVALNCGAIPRDLIESVLFGHVKGAFTGAVADQEGAAAQSNGGTLFLDELGEMDPNLQTKLLRFIQTGTYQRVGEPQLHIADIRFVAATNRDPLEAVRTGRLREDLYYRLNVVPLHMPPLRERGEDILLIAKRFLEQFAEAEHKEFKTFSPDAEAKLLAYSWPGNVRQLQNVVRNVVVLHNGKEATAEMLPVLDPVTAPPTATMDTPVPSLASARPSPPLPANAEEIELLNVAERRYIERAIELCSGNLQLAARKLGVSPSTIYRKREAWAKE